MMNNILTWAAMIELPIFVAIFRLVMKNKKELEDSLLLYKQNGEHGVAMAKEALADFKLHVARNYVSTSYLKDVETRLTDHLLRIEKKLDQVGRNR